ncbi:MAG: Trm112 family protein [Sphingobacterium composti]
MKITTIHKLCCPFDKADLKLEIIEQTLDKDIRTGSLTCTECKRFYPIISGIPIMNPDEYRDVEIEQAYYQFLELDKSKHSIENFRLIE